MKNNCLIKGLSAALVLASTMANAGIIYDDPMDGSGWSDTTITDAGDYGLVHGLWGSNVQTVSRDFSLSGTQTSVDISFRYWMIDSWDASDYGNFSVDGDIVENFNRGNPYHCVGSQDYLGVFPNPWYTDYQKCFQDVTFTYSTTDSNLNLVFGGYLSSPISDESWAFSALEIVDNGAVTEVASVPEPSTLAIFGLGLIGLVLRRYKKQA
jgi:hypothetical protein